MKIVNNLIEKINNNKNLKIIHTNDGSCSIYNEIINEVYHSRNGTIQESLHVFILNGLNHFSNHQRIKILEVGMGTGLNVILTYLNSNNIKIEYHALEPYPLKTSIISNLNYGDLLKSNRIFKKIHNCSFNEMLSLSSKFNFIKHEIEFLNFNIEGFDLIYYDAFSPRAQAEMWDIENFFKAFGLLNNDGILTTYCSKGSFKRDLKTVGFNVISPKGPFGKREITNAIK